MSKKDLIGNDSKTVVHNCLFAVNEIGEAILIYSDPSLIKGEVLDRIFLEDFLSVKDNIPTETGLYKGKVLHYEYDYFITNGIEYDSDTWLEDVEMINDFGVFL